MSDQGSYVAAFDFDGTLSRRDTMVPFLVQTHGWPRLVTAGLRVAPRARLGNGDPFRDAVKVGAVGRLFRGMRQDELDKLGADYAGTLHEILRPKMLERLRWHQSEGHATVIVSASLAAYLRPLAAVLEIDDVLAVELEAGPDGLLTGRVDGGRNTRGPHKATRLRTWIDGRFGSGAKVEIWAYGDSSGDRELLDAADHAHWVADLDPQ